MQLLTHCETLRLLQAVVFFASRTQHCGKIKLFKLLYVLDFEHFRQTGKTSVLTWPAWCTSLKRRSWITTAKP